MPSRMQKTIDPLSTPRRATSLDRVSGVVGAASDGIVRAVSSVWFLVAVVVVFIVGASLMAVMQNYPTVYDEDYHVGIIQIYAGQVSPFIENASSYLGFGDLDRFGSFLYHWLMSFPPRAVDGLGFSLFTQVVVVRLLSVALFASSVIWTRALLLHLGVSRFVSHLAIAVFLALPLTSAVASTVNYDNLAQPLGAAFLLLVVRAYTADRIVAGRWWAVLVVGALACLTKFTFLPIFAVSLVLLVLRRFVWREGRSIGDVWRSIQWPRRRSVIVWASIVAGALVGAVFAERYLGNVILFGSPAPDCGEIHSDAYCSTYSVWERNERLEASHDADPLTVPRAIAFLSNVWIVQMVIRLSFFGATTVTGREFTQGPVIVQQFILIGSYTVLVLAAVVLVALILRRAWQPIIVSGIVYAVFIFVRNFSEYSRFGEPIATQPRYFALFIPILIAIAGVVIGRVIASFYPRGSMVVKAVVALCVLAAFTQGGFAISFFAFAEPDWINFGSPGAVLFDVLARLARLIIVG
ncbi:hypothetical protein [Labedella gwakjiensis]|uniref:hypothetical protein n=1 Tax=Labedella gwakjiensis TaxID=390269 RepID=UPI00140ADBC0|nr:hypothetical protein [Labedella gwakjiensis]